MTEKKKRIKPRLLNIPLVIHNRIREQLYTMYPVGSVATTDQIMESLQAKDKMNTINMLNKAVRDGEMTREYAVIDTGKQGNRRVVLWTFLDRPDRLAQNTSAPLGAVQPTSESVLNFLTSLKKGDMIESE